MMVVPTLPNSRVDIRPRCPTRNKRKPTRVPAPDEEPAQPPKLKAQRAGARVQAPAPPPASALAPRELRDRSRVLPPTRFREEAAGRLKAEAPVKAEKPANKKAGAAGRAPASDNGASGARAAGGRLGCAGGLSKAGAAAHSQQALAEGRPEGVARAEVAVRKLAGAQGPEGAQPRQRRKRRGAASTAAAPAEAAAGEGGVAVPSASEAVQAGCTLWDLADAAAALEREAEAGAPSPTQPLGAQQQASPLPKRKATAHEDGASDEAAAADSGLSAVMGPYRLGANIARREQVAGTAKLDAADGDEAMPDAPDSSSPEPQPQQPQHCQDRDQQEHGQQHAAAEGASAAARRWAGAKRKASEAGLLDAPASKKARKGADAESASVASAGSCSSVVGADCDQAGSQRSMGSNAAASVPRLADAAQGPAAGGSDDVKTGEAGVWIGGQQARASGPEENADADAELCWRAAGGAAGRTLEGAGDMAGGRSGMEQAALQGGVAAAAASPDSADGVDCGGAGAAQLQADKASSQQPGGAPSAPVPATAANARQGGDHPPRHRYPRRVVRARTPDAQASSTFRAAMGAAQQQGVCPPGAAKPAQSRAARGSRQPAAVPRKKEKRAAKPRAPAAKASVVKSAAPQPQKRGPGRPRKAAPAAVKAVRPQGGVRKERAPGKSRGIAEEQAGGQPASAGLPAAAADLQAASGATAQQQQQQQPLSSGAAPAAGRQGGGRKRKATVVAAADAERMEGAAPEPCKRPRAQPSQPSVSAPSTQMAAGISSPPAAGRQNTVRGGRQQRLL